jgi:hypothetical protein
MIDLRIERLRLDLGDVAIDPERLRRLVQRVAALLAQRVDERAPRGGAQQHRAPQQHAAGSVAVRVEGVDARHGGDDEHLAGRIASDVAGALLGRLL